MCHGDPIRRKEGHRYLTVVEIDALTAECGDQGDVVQILACDGDGCRSQPRPHPHLAVSPGSRGVIVVGRVKTSVQGGRYQPVEEFLVRPRAAVFAQTQVLGK